MPVTGSLVWSNGSLQISRRMLTVRRPSVNWGVLVGILLIISGVALAQCWCAWQAAMSAHYWCLPALRTCSKEEISCWVGSPSKSWPAGVLLQVADLTYSASLTLLCDQNYAADHKVSSWKKHQTWTEAVSCSSNCSLCRQLHVVAVYSLVFIYCRSLELL